MTTTYAPRPAADTEVPRATRSRRPGWRNPRLLIGLALVAGSVLVGARLVAAADDTVRAAIDEAGYEVAGSR